jgi:serine protease Do
VKATLDEFSPQSAKANPGSQKETPGNSSENGRLGLTLQPLTPEAAKKFGIPGDAKGLVVVDVDQEGPASEADIRPGDVILAINRQEVGSTDDVQAALEKAGDRPSLFLISRGGDTAFITIQPAK